MREQLQGGQNHGHRRRQDERICGPAQELGEPRYVIRVSGADVTSKVDRHVLAPVRGGLQSAAAAVVKQYEISRPAERLNLTGEPVAVRRPRSLMQRKAHDLLDGDRGSSTADLWVGAVQSYVISDFCSMEPTSWALSRLAIEEDRALAVAGKLFMKIVGNPSVIGIKTKRNHGHRSNWQRRTVVGMCCFS